MKRIAVIAAILGLILVVSSILAPMTYAAAPPPAIKRPMQLVEATNQDTGPESVDPAWALDPASGELIQNVYDTLLVFNGEHTDEFLPNIAVNWTLFPISETGPEGQQWHYRYVFQIRTGVYFQPTYNYSLTPQDVEYSFEREMVQDRDGGSQCTLYEPLLNTTEAAALGDIGNATNPGPDVALVGKMIDHAVESNSTHVWFNIAFNYTEGWEIDMELKGMLCQSYSSILSKVWVNSHVIGTLGRPDWSGNWMLGGDHVDWITYNNPDISPLDDPSPLMYGSGPFMLQTLDYVNQFWELNRNVAYWRGWPADYPLSGPVSPAGYVDSVRSTWAYDWPTRKAMFLAGDVDFVDVPRPNMPEMYSSSTPPFQPPNYPLDGIRCINPLPEMAFDAAFFNFDIDPANPDGPVFDYGVFNEPGIPRDFFGNPSWGVHVRRAFASAFDYDLALSSAYLGEADHPATAIIPGMLYYDPTVVGWTYNLTRAQQEFQAVPGLWSAGFTTTITVGENDTSHRLEAETLKSGVESLNPKFHIDVKEKSHWLLKGLQTVGSWLVRKAFAKAIQLVILAKTDNPTTIGVTLFTRMLYGNLASSTLDNYHSAGALPKAQDYSDPIMDELIIQAIRTPDARAEIFTQIQLRAIQTVPSFTIAQPIGRLFERDWIPSWLYNELRQGDFFYSLYKWYYIPEQFDMVPSQPHGFNLPADVNYDGKVDIKDVSTVAKAFGSLYGPPINPRWAFRADVNNDRKVDIKDVRYVAKLFGKVCPSGPWPLLTIIITSSPPYTGPAVPPNILGVITIVHGTSIAFTASLWVTSPAIITVNGLQWIMNGNPVPSATASLWTYNFPTPGVYNVKIDVFETITSMGWWYTGPVTSSQASHEIEVVVT